MNPPLQGKVAIVTGAGGTAGSAISFALARAGVRVAVNDINPDRVAACVAGIEDEGGLAIGITADVANRYQCVDLVESTRAQWGQLDILVNAAAVKPLAPVLRMDEWAWQRCLDVNLKGAFFMTQLVGRVMIDENAERGGLILNVAENTNGDVLEPGLAAYAAAKIGLIAFTRHAARELAPHAIRVGAVEPGHALRYLGLDTA